MFFLRRGGKILTVLLLFAAFVSGGSSAGLAATVRGVVMRANATPAANDQVHLENQVTGNLYLTDTGSDGSFSVDVPPGWYDLRERSGAVIKSGIRVNLDPVNIGSVVLPPKMSFWRLFQRERLAPVLVESPAPATVNISHGWRIPKVAKRGAVNSANAGAQATSPVSAQSPGAPAGAAAPSARAQSPATYGGTRATSADNIPPPVKPDYEPPITPLAAPGVQ